MQAKIPALKFGIVCRRLSEKIGAQGRLPSESISKGLDCQTALRGTFGEQRLSGALANRHRRPRQYSTRSWGLAETHSESDIRPSSEPGDTDARCVAYETDTREPGRNAPRPTR